VVARHIELTWVCSSCSFRNQGRYTKCQECGDPKDESEQYEMPADPASAATVTDEALLRMAEAGPNWKCAYCGSDQRAVDGSCAQCGAPSPERAQPAPAKDETPAPILTPWREWFHWGVQQKIAAGVAAAVVVGGGVYLYENRERDYDAKVELVSWKQDITVERYTVWTRHGWRESIPDGAYDVVSKGQQVHHTDQVLDGYRTESYSEQVACGQDCTESSPVCHESCTNSKNGFASCNTVCSGGGRSCTTKWCSEQRSREVPQYRAVPRYQEAIEYKIWDWGDQRTVEAAGTDPSAMRWPVEEAKVGQGLGPKEQERERRTGTYRVTLDYDDEKVKFDVALSEVPRFAVGSRHDLKIKDDRIVVDGKPVERKY